MYGDDYTMLETKSSGNEQEEQEYISERSYVEVTEYNSQNAGVKFEPSNGPALESEADISPKLKAIRKYAEEQTLHETRSLKNERVNIPDRSSEETEDVSLLQSSPKNAGNSTDMYSRRSIRLVQSYNDTTNRPGRKQVDKNNKSQEYKLSESSFSAELDQSVSRTK